MPNNEKKHIRIWTAVKDAQAGMMITERKALVIADRNNYFEEALITEARFIIVSTISAFVTRRSRLLEMTLFGSSFSVTR